MGKKINTETVKVMNNPPFNGKWDCDPRKWQTFVVFIRSDEHLSFSSEMTNICCYHGRWPSVNSNSISFAFRFCNFRLGFIRLPCNDSSPHYSLNTLTLFHQYMMFCWPEIDRKVCFQSCIYMSMSTCIHLCLLRTELVQGRVNAKLQRERGRVNAKSHSFGNISVSFLSILWNGLCTSKNNQHFY